MKKISSTILTIAILAGLFSPATARGQKQAPKVPDQTAKELREFEQFVRTQIEKDRIPGMTIGFLKEDVTWVKAFGYADLENKTPALVDSAYRIASTTKPMTAAAIVQLAERGKIDLDAEIQTYLPEYPKQKWPVTVRQLLTHLGGGQGGSGLGPEHVTSKEVVARIAKSPITIEPGTRFVYGTGAYNILAAAIENVSGQSFEAYLKENLWLPAGMKDTRIDDVRGIVPNRVRGYDLADGEIKNAPFINVSSRFGGGGVTSTVPDLLRWARFFLSGKVVSPKWYGEILKPVATTARRWSGPGDGAEYYTLGWMIRPMNGNFLISHHGSQKGTDSAFFVFPEKRMAITILTNLEFGPLEKYARRLYETLTGEAWSARVYARNKLDGPIVRALDDSYNYGALHFAQHQRAYTDDQKELAESFAYFNTNANRESLKSDFKNVSSKIRDGRHPVGDNSFIKLGSFMAAKLAQKNGPASFRRYRTMGALSFFADYVRLYKTDTQIPQELQFTPEFEKMIERWDADWAATWNSYTRNLMFGPSSDFEAIGARLRKEFSGKEVYPDFSNDLQRIQQGEAALSASKLGVDLFPHSDELLFNLAYFLIIAEQTEQGRSTARRIAGNYERPVVYFKRAFESNPSGVMRAETFVDLGRRWLPRPQMHDAAITLVRDGLELHPQVAALHELLGDLLVKKNEKDLAVNSYRRAFELDPKRGNGASLDEYIKARVLP